MSDRTDLEIPPTGQLPETPAPEGDRPLSAREQMMQRIVANAERQREAEMGHWEQQSQQDAPDVREQHAATRPANASLGEVEADRDYQDPYAVEETPEPAGKPAPEDAEPQSSGSNREGLVTAAPVASPHTFAVDVDGQQLHVTQEQLIHLARMGAVANQALYRYQMQGQPPAAPAPAPPPVEQSRPAPIVDDERVRQTVKAIQYGDEASAAQALTELVNHVTSRAAAQPIDPVAIGNYAAQRAAAEARQAARLEHETQIIRQEYADIMADPDLAHLAALKVAQLRQRNQALGQQQSDLDVYREAGNLVLDKIGKPRPGQQAQSPVDTGTSVAPQAPNIVVRRSVGEIDARKRAAPRAMSQVIDRRSAAPQAPRPPSGSDIVEMMRKSRGQTSMR